jgi:hypothetical protein
MSSPYSWFNSKAGPRQGAIVRANGKLVHLDYTNRGDTFKVRDTTDRVGMVNLIPRDGKWAGTARSLVHAGTVWVRDHDSAEDAAGALLAKRQAEVDAEKVLTADPVAHLERELKTHDWYSAMSDSYGTTLAGDRHWKEVRNLMARVPAETARTLFAHHAPADFVCPI